MGNKSLNNVYIFSGESYMVRRSVDAVRRTLDIAFPEVNETVFARMPKADELIAACASMPMMAEKRLVVVAECSVLTGKGGAEEAKKVAAYLDRLPDTTVLVMCAETAPDKRRALYKRVKASGHVQEFVAPKHEACVRFAIDQARAQGAVLPRDAALALVNIAGCDYYTIDNEISKLVIYCGDRPIKQADVSACASRSLEYNVFEIHTLFVNKKTGQARALLADILDAERPEMLIGLFARKIRDMYKVKAMQDAGYRAPAIAGKLKMKPFVVDIQIREGRRFSAAALRRALVRLAELDHAIKSGAADAQIALSAVLADIYML